MNKKNTILLFLICLILIPNVLGLEFQKVKTNSEIIDNKPINKDTIFKSLEYHDSKSSKSEFILENPYKESDNPKLIINFNEVCGKVNSYKIKYKDTCVETYFEPIFEENESCTKDTLECYTSDKIIGYKEKNFTKECIKYVDNIPTGIKEYEIKADIKLDICSDGKMGYRIDWIPTFETDTLSVSKPEWAWWNTSFDNRIEIELQGANATLINVSRFIKLNDTSIINDSGHGLLFVDGECNASSGIQLSHELESIKTNDANYFVLLPELNTTNKTICMYYNKEDNTDYSNKNDVWSDVYTDVYHFNTIENSIDSTNLTNNGAIPTTTAKLGNAYDFDGIDDYMSFGVYDCDNSFTVTTWANIDNYVGGGRIFDVGQSCFFAEVSGNKYRVSLNGGTNFIEAPFTAGIWQKITFVNNVGGTDFLYIDNVGYSGSVGVFNQLPGQQTIGNNQVYDRPFDGKLDEFYFSDKILNSDWLDYDYNMVANHDSYTSFGTPESLLPSNNVPNLTGEFNASSYKSYNNIGFSILVEDLDDDLINVSIIWQNETDLLSNQQFNNVVSGTTINASLSNILINSEDNISITYQGTDGFNTTDAFESSIVINETFACEDLIDNDADGFIDFPNDPGCNSSIDNSEFNEIAGYSNTYSTNDVSNVVIDIFGGVLASFIGFVSLIALILVVSYFGIIKYFKQQ